MLNGLEAELNSRGWSSLWLGSGRCYSGWLRRESKLRLLLRLLCKGNWLLRNWCRCRLSCETSWLCESWDWPRCGRGCSRGWFRGSSGGGSCDGEWRTSGGGWLARSNWSWSSNGLERLEEEAGCSRSGLSSGLWGEG